MSHLPITMMHTILGQVGMISGLLLPSYHAFMSEVGWSPFSDCRTDPKWFAVLTQNGFRKNE
jgi:hypothetical protein